MTADAVVAASVALGWLALLFGVAWHADRRAAAGRGWLAGRGGPWLYALSLGVYATSWTFYGSVGRAARDGIGFLPVYLGPVLAAVLYPVLMDRVVSIAKARRVTSIADFIASRYDDSRLLAALVTALAVIGVVPYIALQLKAITTSLAVIAGGTDARAASADVALPVALALGAFAILFGARHLDAAERHEGMVAAIALESLLKLVAFVAVGGFVVWGMYDGWGELFARAVAEPRLAALLTPFDAGLIGLADWYWLTLLSGLAFLLLPRQFQIAVVENTDRAHLRTAAWVVPVYLLAINLFVLPIALAGAMTLAPIGIDADAWVLALPARAGASWLALLVFVGGLSAATGMIIVETIALSTMVSNDLVLPWLLSRRDAAGGADLSRRLLAVRRLSIVGVLLLGYGYHALAGERYPLVSMGLVSFVAVAQFAPAFFGALWWRWGTRRGAIAGLLAGAAVWGWTLLLPTFATAGVLPASLLADGPASIGWLRPHALLGLEGLDPIVHGTVWSLLVNACTFVAVSLWGASTPADGSWTEIGAVDTRARAATAPAPTVDAVADALARILGAERAGAALAEHAARRGPTPRDVEGRALATPALLRFAEARMAGAIGTASARLIVGALSPAAAAPVSREAMLDMIEETTQVLEHARVVERQKAELEALAAELRAANDKLRELDRLKDDFVSTVSHELRTPLTSIRAFAEILRDNPALPDDERARFVGIVLAETERLTRLINQMLDLAKIESGRAQWRAEPVDVGTVVADAVAATAQVGDARGVSVRADVDAGVPLVALADRDRLMQVMLNLLSNAVKFAPAGHGHVRAHATRVGARIRVAVTDDGRGIDAADHETIFEKFRQAGDTLRDRPAGTGLGLSISRRIARQLGGDIAVDSAPGCGATFTFELPAHDGRPEETIDGP